MAHRGRLNVLANIIGKSPREIFREFEDVDPQLQRGRGDVKYHLGYSGDWTTARGRKVHLSLCFNPSHLEYVNPVALGRMRAKQDRAGDVERRARHGAADPRRRGVRRRRRHAGDAQPEPADRLHASAARCTSIVNNQIGFTTPPGRRPLERPTPPTWPRCCRSRSSTSTAKIPRPWPRWCELALDFRDEFQRDVVIDMYCYRRCGHNEGDEPSFTQPLLYQAIEQRESVRDGYLEHLLELGGVTREEADQIADRAARAAASSEFERAAGQGLRARAADARRASGAATAAARSRTTTSRDGRRRRAAGRAAASGHASCPTDFHPHPKLKQMRRAAPRRWPTASEPLDWAAAEALALASLAVEGIACA